MDHEEGPFKGLEIDLEKCLISILSDPGDLIEPSEDLPEDEAESWFEEVMDRLNDGDMEGVATLAGQEIVDKLLSPTPETWGGNTFSFNPNGLGAVNFEAVLPLLEASGCRYSRAGVGFVYISWCNGTGNGDGK